jgi:four helix bundle protein
MEKKNIIVDKTFDFACDIVDLHAQIIEKKHFQIANQVLGSGTSIGANVREAQRAVSKADFINKLGIALKEADETRYWIELIDKKIHKTNESYYKKIDEIISILTAIINSSKRNF